MVYIISSQTEAQKFIPNVEIFINSNRHFVGIILVPWAKMIYIIRKK